MIFDKRAGWYKISCISMFLVGLMWVSLISAQTRPVKPGPNYVWVPIKILNDGSRIPGHWRLERRIGYVWIAGHENSDGEWVLGHWKPLGKAPRGKIWVPGHVDANGRWISGHWRVVSKKGYEWIPGHYDKEGNWIAGFWKKL